MLSQWELYVFILPAIVSLIIFSYKPMYGILMAFKNFKISLGVNASAWVGVEHFVRFFNLTTFKDLILNTINISLWSTLLSKPIPIVFALLLHQVDCGWYKKLVQNFSYLPHMLSCVIVMNIAQVFCSPRNGVFNILIGMAGGDPINFFGEPGCVFWIYWLTGIWQSTGFDAVVYLAALSGIDMEQLEAAKIDGANRFRIIWNIELPSISETVIILLIMSFGSMFTVSFDKMLLIQNPANYSASNVLATYVYETGLIQRNYGFSTAIGIFNTVVGLACVLVANWISGKVSDTQLF